MKRLYEAHMITFGGQPAKVNCDRKCHKAWGINNRPKVQLSDDEDDYAFLADDELGIAPVDPGTYEGESSKPVDASQQFPNKWCVRECERCAMSDPGKFNEPLELPDFSRRRYNIEPTYRDELHTTTQDTPPHDGE